MCKKHGMLTNLGREKHSVKGNTSSANDTLGEQQQLAGKADDDVQTFISHQAPDCDLIRLVILSACSEIISKSCARFELSESVFSSTSLSSLPSNSS